MMKYLVTVLLLNGLFISAAHSRNCAQAVHNPHCTASSGHSGSQSQATTATGAVGQTPNPAQINNHLGTSVKAQTPVVKIYPMVTPHIVGQALAPAKPVMKIPTGNIYSQPSKKVTGYGAIPSQQPYNTPPQPAINALVPTGNINPQPGQTITGYGAIPSQQPYNVPLKPAINAPVPPGHIYPQPAQKVTGYGAIPGQQTYNVPPQPVINASIPAGSINPQPGQTITGYGAIPKPNPYNVPPLQVYTVPTPVLSGVVVIPQQQIYPVPGKVTASQSAVPQKPVTLAPPKTFTSAPQQQIYSVPGKVITGQSSVPPTPVNATPPKTFTSSPPQQVYPIPPPILIGQAAVPVMPAMKAPTKQTPQTPSKLPNKTPLVVTSTPVIITQVVSSNLHPDIVLQQQMLNGATDLKSLEPHIKDLPVDVYTDKNIHKTTYEKSAKMDNKGFHLTVVGGVKEAAFVDISPLPVAANSDDIIFNFSFASAEIHKDQLSRVDKIVSKHSKNGKQIILMGETDGFGSESYNKHLAVLRANNIINQLKNRGIKIDDVEVRILVRCCRKDRPTKDTLAETVAQRITWVHFQ